MTLTSQTALLAVATLAATACATAQAQNYPVKPVRVLVGFAPGSSTDVAMHPLCDEPSLEKLAATRHAVAATGRMGTPCARVAMVLVALLLCVCVIPLWVGTQQMPFVIAGAYLMQFMVQGAWGVIPAHLSELSPDSVRGFLPGFGYQCGVLLESSVAWLEAVFAEHTSYANAMALTAATVFLLAVIATAMGKEKRGQKFAGGS